MRKWENDWTNPDEKGSGADDGGNMPTWAEVGDEDDRADVTDLEHGGNHTANWTGNLVPVVRVSLVIISSYLGDKMKEILIMTGI